MAIRINRSHTPKVHVTNLKGVRTRHVENSIARREVVVNPCIHSHFTKTEIFVCCQFKQQVVTRTWLRPVEGGLGVRRKVVPGLVPYSQTISRRREADGSRWRTTAPLVGDAEGRLTARGGGLRRMEDNALCIRVRFVLSTNGDQEVQRVIIASIKVILDRMVQVKSEGVAALVSIDQRYCGGPV